MPFKLLSTPVKKYIRERKWDGFRPIQTAAAQRIMTTDFHFILASKTASGKTEAAFLPVISRIENGPGVRVLYISPLIALINDQLARVEDLCRYIDIKVTRWHGDASREQKKKLAAEPQGILLITPESIESIFVNWTSHLDALFCNLQFIILDEIHSFVGTARGCHLQSLLARTKAVTRGPVRFIGLSATLGDFEAVRSFFGAAGQTKILRDKTQKEASVSFKYYESPGRMLPAELILDLYRETLDKRSLVFPNSRGRVEEVAVKLKKVARRTGDPQRYFAHHSSVSKELREYAEHFAKKRSRYSYTIICTSTLELGIDIGMVDLIVQVDATFSVSSLVQRFGRSGRQEGEKSNLLLYATNPWSLLQALACVELFREGFIEPVTPVRYPIDILFQQVLSILKETLGISKENLRKKIAGNFAFSTILPRDYEKLIEFMISAEYIEVLQGELIIGINAEKILNSRSFYSVFKTENNYKVFFRDKVIGELTSSLRFQVDQNIFLAGRMWKIIDMDGRKLEIYVKEAADGKRPVFSGSGGDIHPRIREKMLEILTADFSLPDCDETTAVVFGGLREQFENLREKTISSPDSSMEAGAEQRLSAGEHAQAEPTNGAEKIPRRPLIDAGFQVEFYTFTGSRINRTLQQLFKELFGSDFFYDEHKSSFRLPAAGVDVSSLVEELRQLLARFEALLGKALGRRESVFEFSKWGDYLPKEFKKKILLYDYFDLPGTKAFLDNLSIKVMNDE
ncbi:MAG: DEAD/DEAH box helicase [Candidatus Aminicenantes bacterium]|nr:DEAD/DEAH box helicase [Candidatus Aminicenantes bacterium]